MSTEFPKSWTGLKGGYDYDKLLEHVKADPVLYLEYEAFMSVWSKVVLEVLTEPKDGRCPMFSRQYYHNMVKKFNNSKGK